MDPRLKQHASPVRGTAVGATSATADGGVVGSSSSSSTTAFNASATPRGVAAATGAPHRPQPAGLPPPLPARTLPQQRQQGEANSVGTKDVLLLDVPQMKPSGKAAPAEGERREFGGISYVVRIYIVDPTISCGILQEGAPLRNVLVWGGGERGRGGR